MSVVRYPFPDFSSADSVDRVNQNNFVRLSDSDRVLDEPNERALRDAPGAATPTRSAATDEPAEVCDGGWAGLAVDQTLGQLMTEFRKHRGLSREQVAEQTNIPAYYVRMIESDSYDAIPDQLYLLPFFQRYAIFLGLDAQKVVARFIRDFEKAENEPFETPAPKTATAKALLKWRQIATAAVILGILLPCIAWGIGTTRTANRNAADHSSGIVISTIPSPPVVSTEARPVTAPPVPTETSDSGAVPIAPTASKVESRILQKLRRHTRPRRGRNHLRHRRYMSHA